MKHCYFCDCGKCDHMRKSSLNDRTVRGLQGLLGKLESGKPIEATRVERVETPDGPMHIRRKVTL